MERAAHHWKGGVVSTLNAKCWIVVNTTNLNDGKPWPDLRIPDVNRPAHIHTYKDRAEAELLRLAGSDPLSEFALFECVAYSVGKQMPDGRPVFMVEPVQEERTAP